MISYKKELKLEEDLKPDKRTYQHDGDLLPWREELESKTIGNVDQAMVSVSVQTMTLLELIN